ncbi:MAG TPA: YARHG domain-containing protein [Kofleriaceae bacterium]|nr:YARHG domain-containing protein [Kofleriaceae bacterium]
MGLLARTVRSITLVGVAAAVALVVLAPGAASADDRPLYYARALTPADLEGRTLRELVLMRNTIYARAGHQFRKKWLHDYFTAQPWYKPLPKDDNKKVTAVDRANAALIAQAEQSQTRADMKKRRDDILARQRAGKATPADEIEIGLLNTRLGQWVSAEAAKPPADVSPLEDPSQLDRLLTVEQLSNLSRRDLRILRNTIYARHGRQFKSKLLQEYFDTMEWYKPDPAFTDKRLNKIDVINVRMIKSVEDTLGGSLTEDEQRAEDNMSGF